MVRVRVDRVVDDGSFVFRLFHPTLRAYLVVLELSLVRLLIRLAVLA
jgi:hypothetical protein